MRLPPPILLPALSDYLIQPSHSSDRIHSGSLLVSSPIAERANPFANLIVWKSITCSEIVLDRWWIVLRGIESEFESEFESETEGEIECELESETERGIERKLESEARNLDMTQ